MLTDISIVTATACEVKCDICFGFFSPMSTKISGC